jgi:hypothetical protein
MKKALLAGINDYPGSQNDLLGCVNDATNNERKELTQLRRENRTLREEREIR